eukprot:gb/GECH01009247.1/.p1 GENE.gb/GECH01009247.1/~~gb/GECH01009247.1/.p1  ORF type:complete len:312 (+),score=72.24 gb/GECH01009247.1/:1-936(+)
MEETDYKFNGEGKLVDKHSGKPFVFQTQEHYKKVGNAVVSYIQNIMRGPEFQMKEMVLPLDQNQDSNSNEKINTPKTHIFYTSDAFTTLDKPVLIILQGKGPVRAGQWSRSLCVNDSLETGSILPYLREAQHRNWEIVVLNPNLNQKNGKQIPHHETPEQHVRYVWDQVLPNTPRTVVVAAFSYGGQCMIDLLSSPSLSLHAIAFIDSVHILPSPSPRRLSRFLRTRTCNWAASHRPLDDDLDDGSHSNDTHMNRTGGSGCPCLSAGHPRHEYAPSSAMRSVFLFLEQQIENHFPFEPPPTGWQHTRCCLL